MRGKVQYTEVIEMTTFIKKQIHSLQRICGESMYYAQEFDSTMIHTLNDLASQVTTGTLKPMKAQVYFLNYYAINQDTSIVYYASGMIIRGDTDTAYFVASIAGNINVANIFMGNNERNNQK